MRRRNIRRDFVSVACGIAISFGAFARADIPVGYMGKPFNPAVAGGPKLPAGVKAGPYTIPGRLDFVNYDLGGDGIAYHTGDHLVKGGAGYRIDTPPTATLSLTSACIPNVGTAPCQNVWYDTSPTLDGTIYPTPTTADFTIGAVQVGDWFNFTVNVATTGTYSLSSTWASGNGPPGGEGGNGDMGLEVFSNGTKLATWSAVFPNYQTEADFHHWKAYPNFATIMLTAGPQVIKLQSTTKHLQPDYVDFTLGPDDGGTGPGADSSASGSSGGGGATTGTGATSGVMTGGSNDAAGSGTSGVGTSGVGGGNGGTAGATSGATSGSGTATGGGGSGVGATSGAGAVPTQSGGCACSTVPVRSGGGVPLLLALGGVLFACRRRAGRD